MSTSFQKAVLRFIEGVQSQFARLKVRCWTPVEKSLSLQRSSLLRNYVVVCCPMQLKRRKTVVLMHVHQQKLFLTQPRNSKRFKGKTNARTPQLPRAECMCVYAYIPMLLLSLYCALFSCRFMLFK